MTGQPFLEFAQKNLDIVNLSGDEAMVRCIVHDDSKASCQFNVRTGLWHCFACSEGGSIKRMCRELGITVFADPEPDLEDIYAKLKELKQPSRKGQPKTVPESLLKRYNIPTGYWAGRGFTKEVVKAFDLGSDPMNDLVTIPLRDEQGRLLGVIKRYLADDIDLRYKYPKGFKRSLNLFASWMIEASPTDKVAICEGSLDAIRCWMAGIPAVAVYGSSISPAQVRLLRRLGVGQVVLFFDNDKAGKKARDLCLGKKHRVRKGKAWTEYEPKTDLRRWFLVYDVNYKPGDSDPGDMTVKQIKKRIKNASLLNVS